MVMSFSLPDPAGTHLISYRVTKPDGTAVEGSFPDLDAQWPRLFYHRHMMLAEQTQVMGRASGQHYADHLATLHGGPSRIDWMIHMLLSPRQVIEGKPLDDRSTYQVLESLDGRPRTTATVEGPIAIPEAGPMRGIFRDLRNYLADAWQAWNRFWFTPADPATLSLIRLLAGGMLFYTHLVWSLDLQAFVGQEGWLPVDYLRSEIPIGNLVRRFDPNRLQRQPHRNLVGLERVLLDQTDLAIVGRASVRADRVFLFDLGAVQPHDGRVGRFCWRCRMPSASALAHFSAWTRPTACWPLT